MRWLVRLAGLLIVLVAVVLGLLLLLPGDRIAKIAAEKISQATGRQVTMSGDTRVSFYPVLGVSTGRVEVANADWSDAGPMLTAESLKIGVESAALFGGDIRITGLEAVKPKILLEKANDGRVNWEVGVEGVAPSGQSQDGAPAQSRALALTLDRALITGAKLTYVDYAAGQTTVLDGMDFDLRWPDYEGAATFDVVLRPAGDAVEISGEIDKVGQFLDGSISDVKATIAAPGGTLSIAGKAGVQPQFGGKVSGNLKDTARFLAALGVGGVDVPAGLGKTISTEAGVTLTQDMRLSLRDVGLTLDNNHLSGAADVFLDGSKPRLNAQLSAGALDFSALAGGSSGGDSSSSGGDGWSKTPIDASGLAMFDGEIALVADSINLGDLKLGKTRVLMTLKQSRAVFELREVRAYDGNLTGEFVLNNRSGLSVGGQIKARGINLETFLADAMDVSRFAASADGDLKFLGVGQSTYTILNSLKGSGGVKTGRGVISGIDLDRLMRSGDVGGGTTVFDSMGATFSMKNGNLYNDDLLMTLPLAKAEGKGRVGLGARDIDYWFTPVLLEGDTRKGLAIPVHIRGPWSNPKISPDLEKALDLNFKKEKKKLKQKARKEVNKAIEKKLGVTVEEGQSVEDALKKKLEKKATKGILKLFQ